MTPDRQDKPPLSAADIIMATQREDERKRVLKEEGKKTIEKRLALVVDELQKLVDEQYPELEDIDRRFGLTSSFEDVNKGPLLSQGRILKEKGKPDFEPEVTYDEEGALWKGKVSVSPQYPNPARLSPIDLPLEADSSSEKKEEVKKLVTVYIGLMWNERENSGNGIHLVFWKEGVVIRSGSSSQDHYIEELKFSDLEFHDKFQHALVKAYSMSGWYSPGGGDRSSGIS